MYVKVLVIPGAKREELLAESETKLYVSVREPAEHNAANRRVLTLVAAHYGVPPGKVRIISGHHAPSKMLSVDLD